MENELKPGQIIGITAAVMGVILLINWISETILVILGVALFGIFAVVAFQMIKEWIKDTPERKKREEEEKKKRMEEERKRNMAFLEASMEMYKMQGSTSGYTGTISTPAINTSRLRNDMMNYYGTAMHSGSPMAQADLIHVQRASDAELIREAEKNGFDLNKYTE